MAYRLHKRESLSDGLRRIAGQQCARAARALEDPTDEHVHEARVRIKRVRAVLALLRGSMGRASASESQTLGEVARSLGGARDAASLCEALAGLRERFGGLDPGAFEAVAAELARRAERARGAGVGAGTIALARQALLSAGERAGAWAIEGEGFEVVRGGLARTYARARRDRRWALSGADVEERHAWRTVVRRLAEQVRVMERCWSEVLKPHARGLREIAGRLGEEHDLALLSAALRGEAEAFGGAPALAIARLAERAGGEIVRSCRRPARRALVEPARAFVGRVEGLWRAWR